MNKHASVKILALSFLLMIGVLLVAEAFDVHVPRGYVYFSMAFALVVEFIQMRYQANLSETGEPEQDSVGPLEWRLRLVIPLIDERIGDDERSSPWQHRSLERGVRADVLAVVLDASSGRPLHGSSSPRRISRPGVLSGEIDGA